MLLASSRPHVWRALLLAGLLLLVACGGLRRELRVREDFGASGVASRVGTLEPRVDVFAYGRDGSPSRQEDASATASRDLQRAMTEALARRGAVPVEPLGAEELEEACLPLRDALRARVWAAPVARGSRPFPPDEAPSGPGAAMLRADTDLLLVSYAYDGVAHRPGHGADKQGMPSPRAWAGTILKPAETTILVVAAVDRAGAVAWTSEVQSPWRGALQRDMIGGLVEAALGDLLSRDPRRMEAELERARHPVDREVFGYLAFGRAVQRVTAGDPRLGLSVSMPVIGVRTGSLVLGATMGLGSGMREGNETSVYVGALAGAALPLQKRLRVELLAEGGWHRAEWSTVVQTRGVDLPYVGGRAGVVHRTPVGALQGGMFFGDHLLLGVWVVARQDLARASVSIETASGAMTKTAGGTRAGVELGFGFGW